MRTPHILRRWLTATRNNTSANNTVAPMYFSAVSRAWVPSSSACAASSLRLRGLLQLGIVVLGHVGGPRRRRGRGERCRLQPGIERRPVFRAEPAHQHRLKLGIVGALGHQPLVERGRIGRQPLLTGDGHGGGLDPVHPRLGVQDRLAAVPLGRLEATPGRGDRSHRQQEDPTISITSSQRRLSLTASSRSVSLWATSRFMSSGISEPPPRHQGGLVQPHGGAVCAAGHGRPSDGSSNAAFHRADMVTIAQAADRIRRG
jgi:hypothetical protein